jgi:hypothetical protein
LTQKEFGILIQRETSMCIGRITLPLLFIVGYGIGQIVMYGFSQFESLFLLVGTILTLTLAFCYGMINVMRAYGSPKKLWMMFAAIGGLFPYLFFLYLFFYSGLWSLSYLVNGFSLFPIFKTIAFCLLAYFALNKFYKLTEIGRIVDVVAKENDISY